MPESHSFEIPQRAERAASQAPLAPVVSVTIDVSPARAQAPAYPIPVPPLNRVIPKDRPSEPRASAPVTYTPISQPAVSPATASPPPEPTQSSPPPVHQQIATEITVHATFLARDATTEFVVELHPPELGKVQVHLQNSHDGLTAHLLTADEGTRAVIEGQLEQLRERLHESAIPVVRFSVGDMASQGQSPHQQSRHPWQPPAQQRTSNRQPARMAVFSLVGEVRDRLDVIA